MDYEKLYHDYKKLYEDSIKTIEELRRKIKELESRGRERRIRNIEIPFSLAEYQKLKDAGYSYGEIAKSLNVPVRKMYRYLEKLQDNKKVKERIVFSYQRYEVLHNEGLPDYKIAEEMGISPSSLSKHLKKYHSAM